ncbi:radical SAM family heme chaperone HemW [Paraoerskovia marina]|uniref:radical SAM family heme chaperone HemW n=1 Tax=Paraoerskovia marina TaxID=545619 RepID=UPI00049224F3|nr:radical SAM family heme chaperone HemW [Paraoerskovia marina]
MSPALPDGEDAPRDGSLPGWVAGPRGSRFGVYLHVPFCTVRCGYCDFNTYTATELGGGASQIAYARTALAEIELAGRTMRAARLPEREASTVFVGGGTPTMLPASDLVRMLDGVRDTWGLADGAEVTTEANPDSVTPESLAALAAGGFTRVSFGMQSAVPHVLATLERTHDPDRVPDVVRWARDAGLAVSLDLIYGTPGESLDDWRRSLDTVLETGVDHVSAYALVVEPGTKMGAQVRRGELELPSGDDQAEKYEVVDRVLTSAGLSWYEVSNWSRTPEQACRHNLAYWRGDDWWGIGPGAHSYLGPSSTLSGERGTETESSEPSAGLRWWNVKHPRRYAALLESGESPAAGRERLDVADAQLERVMLGIRLRDGLDLAELSPDGRRAVAGHVANGSLDGRAALAGRAVLTLQGRLLADAVVRDLTD